MLTDKIKSWPQKCGVWFFAACLAVLTGCETPAQRLEPVAVDQAQTGVTTRQEVLQQFGPPIETHTGRDRTLLLYRRSFQGSAGGYGPTEDSSITLVSFLFGPDDRLIQKHYSAHKLQTFYAPGSVAVGNNINDELTAKIRPNLTTLQEAENLLGEPTAESLTLSGILRVSWTYQDANFVSGNGFKVFHVLLNSANVVIATGTYDSH